MAMNDKMALFSLIPPQNRSIVVVSLWIKHFSEQTMHTIQRSINIEPFYQGLKQAQ